MGGVTVILYPQSVPPTGTLGGAGVRMGRSWTLVQGTDGGMCPPPSGRGGQGTVLRLPPKNGSGLTLLQLPTFRE